MWTEELIRQHRAELERQAVHARLVNQLPDEGARRLRLRGWMAAALHRAADRMAPATGGSA